MDSLDRKNPQTVGEISTLVAINRFFDHPPIHKVKILDRTTPPRLCRPIEPGQLCMMAKKTGLTDHALMNTLTDGTPLTLSLSGLASDHAAPK